MAAEGLTATESATWAGTVMAAVPLASPEAAVMVAVPAAAAVTSPAAETAATAESEELQSTAAPAISRPLASKTVAESCSASPTATVAAEGLTATESATWAGTVGGGGFGLGPIMSPPQGASVTETARTTNSRHGGEGISGRTVKHDAVEARRSRKLPRRAGARFSRPLHRRAAPGN